MVAAGETLQSIAGKYQVPWQLLAKINGIADPTSLEPGQELKVLEGPFSAIVDLSKRTMTLMLQRRYAGQFALEIDPAATIEEGQWTVDQKQLTPAAGSLYGSPTGSSEDRSLLLGNAAKPDARAIYVRGPGEADPVSAEPRDRVLRLSARDVGDVFDILSEGSSVTIRK
jgi:LysM repeat protein